MNILLQALEKSPEYQQLLDAIDAVNADSTVHGCLLLRPLPPPSAGRGAGDL